MNAVESLTYFGSEIILAAAFVVALIVDFFAGDKKLIGYIGLIALAIAWFTAPAAGSRLDLFYGFFVLDGFTHFFRLIIYIAVGLTIIASFSYKGISEKIQGEFYALMIALALLLTLMASAPNLLMVFVGIEAVSLTSYLLVGFQRDNPKGSEAALKYALFGAVSTALMLFGMSFVFGATGSMNFGVIASQIDLSTVSTQIMIVIGLLFIFAGVGFKISAAPFHMWAPDVYQGAPTPVAAFLTVAPKALGFAVLARLLFTAFAPLVANWANLLAALSVITMTVGNIFAVSQSDTKRLLAYSSVAQAGYILVALAVPGPLGLKAVLIYSTAYLFTNLGAFFTILAVERNTGDSNIASFNGLSKRNPFLAISMMVFLLSLAGIPPMAGFIGKVYIFSAVVEANAYALAIAVALNSAVAAFYYFKIVRAMYLTSASTEAAIENPIPIKLVLGATLLGTVLIGIFPAGLIRFVEQSLASFLLF